MVLLFIDPGFAYGCISFQTSHKQEERFCRDGYPSLFPLKPR